MKNDIRTLDLNLLKALDALITEGSVTAAARRLSLTQPAVSGMLNRLRDYFADPLFVRARRGMVPTERARQLALPVKAILSEIERVLQPVVFDPLTAELTITIAATDYATKAVIVPLMQAVNVRAPGIRLAVRPVNEAQTGTQLENGDIDLALLTPATTPGDLHGRTLYQESWVCLLRSGHPVALSGGITLDQFCQQDHILVSSSGSFYGPTDEALARIGRSRRVGMSVNSFLVLEDILQHSDMMAVVPRRLVTSQGQLVIMPPPLDIPGFSKSMAWHERTHHDPAHRWLRQLLTEVSQPPPQSRSGA